MVRHTDGENATYWANQARGAIDDAVHGKAVDEVVAIAGDVVVVLGDGWNADDARALRDALYDRDFPPIVMRGDEMIRVQANDHRLSAPY